LRIIRISEEPGQLQYTQRVKPLFVPLRTEHFRAFAGGTKTTEYRRLGPRWNARTCVVGRPVTLSHGYSGERLSAVVKRFCVVLASDIASTIYPAETQLAAIEVELTASANSASAIPQTVTGGAPAATSGPDSQDGLGAQSSASPTDATASRQLPSFPPLECSEV
jgi:hypothetical protein